MVFNGMQKACNPVYNYSFTCMLVNKNRGMIIYDYYKSLTLSLSLSKISTLRLSLSLTSKTKKKV